MFTFPLNFRSQGGHAKRKSRVELELDADWKSKKRTAIHAKKTKASGERENK